MLTWLITKFIKDIGILSCSMVNDSCFMGLMPLKVLMCLLYQIVSLRTK